MKLESQRAVCVALLLTGLWAAEIAVAQPAVKTAPAGVPIAAGPDAQRIRVRRFFAIPTNEKVGVRQDSLFCTEAGDIIFSAHMGTNVMQMAPGAVRRELELAGYPKVAESAFDSASTGQPADVEYELAATLADMQLNLCNAGMTARKGEVWVSLDWELFSTRERRVVYRATHAGSYRVGDDKPEITSVYRAALVSATRNLLADPAFHAQAKQRVQPTAASPAGDALAVVRRSAGKGSALDRMPALQSAVATIVTGAGSGSGFFLSAEGHVLTNHHVVGDAKFVKVRLANGREMLGEVLRSVPFRDVALVKTESVSLAPLEVSENDLKTGDEVFALGSPFGETFASTVSRGIVSSYREVEQQRWLQSDVAVRSGASGGPLIGPDGAVVGVASRGTTGVNLFIPIRDAMRALRLEFAPSKP